MCRACRQMGACAGRRGKWWWGEMTTPASLLRGDLPPSLVVQYKVSFSPGSKAEDVFNWPLGNSHRSWKRKSSYVLMHGLAEASSPSGEPWPSP